MDQYESWRGKVGMGCEVQSLNLKRKCHSELILDTHQKKCVKEELVELKSEGFQRNILQFHFTQHVKKMGLKTWHSMSPLIMYEVFSIKNKNYWFIIQKKINF